MIIELKKGIEKTKAEHFASLYQAILLEQYTTYIIVTSSQQKELLPEIEPYVERVIVTDSDIQLAGKSFLPQKRVIDFGNFSIGGNLKKTIVITGPCSVESMEQIEACARLCVETGVKVLRAGAYKPRTSPYSFQGLEKEGLKLLDKMRQKFGLKIITEVKDFSHVWDVIEYADIIQIGAKAMYDQGILRACAKTTKPVLIKRGFGSTLQEFVQAAEFVLCGGNPNVLLCERGIRTFETKTRFTLDLCGVSWLKENINLPIVVDPSHAMGIGYGVPDLSAAAMAMGVDGILIETHPEPAKAQSDAEQQLNFEQFRMLHKRLRCIANAIGYELI
jgi:3-deoxy-7-phosphoheptulonate synthase